jgi:saccharopine dehydrogenase-like NADP-dependent oxidoreductase
MAEAVADYFNKYSSYKVTFGTIDKESGQKLTNISPERFSLAVLDAVKDKNKLTELVRSHDITISLLPSFLHIHVAKVCLKEGKNMVTSSYISESK